MPPQENVLVPLSADAEPPPIRQDASGACRVGNSRVPLEAVVEAFDGGLTPETIAQEYPTLDLVDVYGVITYYLRHRDEVRRYIANRNRHADEMRKKIEAIQGDMGEIRERLLARAGKK